MTSKAKIYTATEIAEINKRRLATYLTFYEDTKGLQYYGTISGFIKEWDRKAIEKLLALLMSGSNPSIQPPLPLGEITQYLRGDHELADFTSAVLTSVIVGTTAESGVMVDGDALITLLNKLQTQILNFDLANIAFNGNRAVKRSGLPLVNAGGTTLKAWIENYFFPAVSASLSMSSIADKELGTSVTITIAGTVTLNDALVTEVRVKRGTTLISTLPAGTTSISVNDAGITSNQTYTIEVDTTIDGTAQPMITASRTVSFYAPSYYGVGAAGLTEAQIKTLTKNIWNTQVHSNISYSPTLQRYYYVYDGSFPDLTAIIDQNGFNVTAGFTKTTLTFTLADGITTHLMKIYYSNVDTTQVNFKLSYS